MQIVIIGGDAGGMSAASQIRRRQPEWPITVLERGRFTSYAACGIPYYFAGDVDDLDELVVVSPREFREQRGIDAREGWEATGIDLDARRVVARGATGGEASLPFDRLLVATGASPIVPPWEGLDLAGVALLRNLEDALAMERLLTSRPRRATVIGAGYIGLEMAEAFTRHGLAVTLVEKLGGVMGGAGDRLTELVAGELDARGIAYRFETTVSGFLGEAGRLRAVATDRGEIETDLALIALGVRPNVALARAAGIPLGTTGAIRVDERQATGAPGVWAAGDCAEALHLVTGQPAWVPLALTANRQGRVAGAVMADGEDRFPGIVGSAVTRLFDLAIAKTGIDEAAAAAAGIACESVEATAPAKAHYFPGHAPLWVKILFRSDDRRVIGAVVAGRDESAGKRSDILATAITAGMTVDQVADLDLCYAPPFSPVWDPVLQAANRARFARQQAAG